MDIISAVGNDGDLRIAEHKKENCNIFIYYYFVII